MKNNSVIYTKFKAMKLYQKAIGVIVSLLFLILAAWFLISAGDAKVYNVDFSHLNIETVDNEYSISLRYLSLPRGSYTLELAYLAPMGGSFAAYLENDVSIHDTLAVTQDGNIDVRSYPFEMQEGSDRASIIITSDASAPISLAYMTISSPRLIYTDGIIWALLLLLMIPIVWMGLILFEKSPNKLSICVLIAVALMQMLPFIVGHGVIRAVDTKGHLMRIEGIYYGLLDGQLPVVIQPEWNNTYGQLGVLYPNVFLYAPAILRVIKVSLLGATKMFLFATIVAGALISYAAVKSVLKKDWQICLACFAIMMDNMRVHDLLTGGKIGGSFLAELFLPLLVVGLIDLFYEDGKKWYMVGIGVAGIICCHVTSASVAAIFVLIFTLINIKKLKEGDRWKAIGKAVILFGLLSLGTLVSFVQFYFGDWGQDALQWRNFLSTLWSLNAPFADNRWTSVFILMIVSALLMICIRVKCGKELYRNRVRKSYLSGLFAAGLVILWMSTAYFPWVILTRISFVNYYTNMLQSGGRFLSLAACTFAVCIPLLIDIILADRADADEEKQETAVKKPRFGMPVVLVTVCVTAIAAMAVIGIAIEEVKFLKEDVVYVYYDEISGDVEYNFDDYLPKGTLSEWYVSDTGYVSDEEHVASINYERCGTHVYYSYTNSAQGAYVEFPKFYYKGYVARDELGNNVDVYKGDRNRVRVYLDVTDSQKDIEVWYKVSAHLVITGIVSYLAWIAITVLALAKLFGIDLLDRKK